MKEIQVTKYEAEDGTVFDFQSECANYEAKLRWRPEVMDILQRLKTICDENTCSSCSFFDTEDGHCLFSKGLVPCNYEINKIMKGDFS